MTDNPIDYASAYHDLRVGLMDVLRDADSAALDAVAPATPAWRVRDVAAHMAGVCDDVANGNINGVGSDSWTDTQVAKRRDWAIEKVLDDWDEHASKIEPNMNDLAPAIGQMLADAATHEQDILGALGAPGRRDSAAGVIGVEWALDILGARIAHQGLGTLRIEHEAGVKEIGKGEPVTNLRASRFELGRAMTGRRSVAQMRALDWDGPFDPEELVLARGLFEPPTADLVE
jgi:hypothetical protein